MKYLKTGIQIKKKDLFFLIAIPLIPLVGYVYLLVETDIKELAFLNFSLKSNHYPDVYTWFWTIGIKAVMFLTLALWFISCKHWWRYTILIPLIFTINKLLVVLNEELAFVDRNDIFFSLMISVPVILFLFYISRKLNYYSKSKTLNDELNSEINELMHELLNHQPQNHKKAKENFNLIKSKKEVLSKKEYLKKRLSFREDYLNS